MGWLGRGCVELLHDLFLLPGLNLRYRLFINNGLISSLIEYLNSVEVLQKQKSLHKKKSLVLLPGLDLRARVVYESNLCLYTD